MKFLIAGLGSIGRRHFRNLIALGEKDIILLRSHRATLPDDEETRASSRQALRGERGWRASKEQPRTWETRQHERGETGRHNGTSFLAGVGEAHSSEEAG